MITIISRISRTGKWLLVAFTLVVAARTVSAQTYLTGTVFDTQDSTSLIGASVKALQDATLVRGVITDINGAFRMELPPGEYTIEVNYTGFQSQSITGVRVLEGQENKMPRIDMSNAVLNEVVIVCYKIPLIEQDKTSAGQTLTSSQLSTTSAKRDYSKMRKPASRSSKNKAKPAPSVPSYAKIKPAPGRTKGLPDSTQPRDVYGSEQYNTIVENPFQEAKMSDISTFSIDVDQASYTNIRRMLNQGYLPSADAVRIEEMINYFDYQYRAPAGDYPFEANVEVAPCPWNADNRLLLIGLQGASMDVGQLPSSNFVFLIDVSGSMQSENKLPLVQQSLSLLAEQMRPNDRVAIVVYAGAAGLVLESTPGTDKAKIKNAIAALQAGGSTAGGAGIQLAYDTALKNLVPGGNNRVILCTDGDFNVGPSSEADLVQLIEEKRKSGVYLTVLGFGEGNYQDGKMQQLADKGNGNHAYIDQLSEAKKVLIKEFGGTLFAIAKDVKLQLHFNPELVASYRLIGYENRMLATEDFNDDTKDAGELGAGHRVTALYEIVPKNVSLPTLSKQDAALVMSLTPSQTVRLQPSDLMVLQMRYKKPSGTFPSRLVEYRLNGAALDGKTMSDNFSLAASVAEFGLLLRNSKYKGNASYAQLRARMQGLIKNDPNGYRTELLGLVESAEKLAEKAK